MLIEGWFLVVDVTLRPITEENWAACVELVVAPEQTEFVASNAMSLAQAAYQRRPSLIPLGVYHRETMVGFVMYVHPEAAADDQGRHWIYRVMVGQQYQGKGYGRAAMETLLARMRATIPADRPIALDYHERNAVAARLYQQLGFVPTGERDGAEIIAVLPASGQARDAR